MDSGSTTPVPSLETHLTYPTLSEDEPEPSTSKLSPQPRQTIHERLYVGNLHPSVDEYALLQIFSKFGKVTKLDFLFHKAGLLKGKPRGYAFVEYGNKDDASKALGAVHEKLLRGRQLVVTFAQQAPIDLSSTPAGSSAKSRKVMAESGRPTTLSMIKSGMGNRHGHEGTGNKIAMMEAKLRQMEMAKAAQSTSDAPTGSLPHHVSLPPKPLPSSSTLDHDGVSTSSQHEPQRIRKPPPPLPPLPLLPPQRQEQQTGLKVSASSGKSKPPARKGNVLAGVKLGKPKEKIAKPADVPLDSI